MAIITEENNKNKKKKIKKSSFVTDKEAMAAARAAIKELQEEKLEDIRRKAMKDLASEVSSAEEKIKAGYLILTSYGYDGNYLKSSWRKYHAWFH
jgi:hypothetical protein